ncbi:hypothetical protein BJ508DRAFT_91012 [Ascobolus immersus RN42]|uniref:Uncharacterized protein n=1 Tax=Ascobolus immersus RN42 TaxID=1160509 RepID=A0A3N4I8E2_ASCIM|nr:hypothetical protein BJ508DRAFT_91012 [Ascobolus immersus RN42]
MIHFLYARGPRGGGFAWFSSFLHPFFGSKGNGAEPVSDRPVVGFGYYQERESWIHRWGNAFDLVYDRFSIDISVLILRKSSARLMVDGTVSTGCVYPVWSATLGLWLADFFKIFIIIHLSSSFLLHLHLLFSRGVRTQVWSHFCVFFCEHLGPFHWLGFKNGVVYTLGVSGFGRVWQALSNELGALLGRRISLLAIFAVSVVFFFY